jgi:hypothetical protein
MIPAAQIRLLWERGTSTKVVFEPKRGLWDKYILVMDFNLLYYPSIIQEYNIDCTAMDSKIEDEVRMSSLLMFNTDVQYRTGRRRKDSSASFQPRCRGNSATSHCHACQLALTGQSLNERQITYSREDNPGQYLLSRPCSDADVWRTVRYQADGAQTHGKQYVWMPRFRVLQILCSPVGCPCDLQGS